ncbi:MAG: hypothetical protein IM638_09760 [Bacteroidetes bacterium]|nr:hypothetical protein [Bacteroidota bacterium]
MSTKIRLTLLLLLISAMPCFAGFPKGGLIPDAIIIGLFVLLIWFILAHVLGIISFFVQKQWLRTTAIVLYSPMFIVPLMMGVNRPLYGFLLIPMILFFVFVIIRKRK